MIAPCHDFFMAGMMLFPNAGCKGQVDNLMRPIAVNLNPAPAASLKPARKIVPKAVA
jgi:hypothetical protein